MVVAGKGGGHMLPDCLWCLHNKSRLSLLSESFNEHAVCVLLLL